MRVVRSLFVLTAAALLAAPVLGAQEQPGGVRVGLTYDPGRGRPGIVVLPVGGAFGDSIRTIVQRNFDFSDRFTVVSLDFADPGTFRSGPGGALNYPLFARLGAAAVVQITPIATGLHVALHDAARGAVINFEEFPLPAAGLSRDWRMAVHQVSDEVERWIFGQAGIAATRIAYVRGPTIRIIDADGAEEIALPVEGNIYSPDWHPSGSMLVYSTYAEASQIMLVELATGRTRTLVPPARNTTHASPKFSPDGRTVVYSRADENGSDLFSIPVDGGTPRRITVGRGSDNVQPTFSPDGRRIAFMSSRLGRPEVYVMDADGTNPELLTAFDFGDQNYRSGPNWSPDGRLVAFESQFSRRFQVMTINLRDRSTRLLTSEGLNEQPAWSPNGRHLVFTSDRTGSRQLWIIDTETGRLRQLTTSGGAKLGAWSPRLGAASIP